jgi:hypothetical protein
MRPFIPIVAVGMAVLFASSAGCSRDQQQVTICFGAQVVANETNNYTFTSTIKLPPVTVAPMSNLTFDWGGLDKDFLGRSLNPAADLGAAIMMIWDFPLADFETALNADTLYTADLVVSPPLNLPIGGVTSGHLHDFLVNGTAVTPEMFNAYFDATKHTPANSTFIVAVQTGVELGRDIRMLQSFNLDAASTATNVALTDASTKLTYSANLHDLTITGVPAGTPALTLDWSQMKTNALGHPFTEGYVTNAIVGHYTQTPGELEANFLDLDRSAIATYRAQIEAGSVLDFTTLKDDSGAAFPGIDGSGTWLVGLTCGNCRNPAPWYMTIVAPCSK